MIKNIIILILIGICLLLCFNINEPELNTELTQKIDSLNTVVDSLKLNRTIIVQKIDSSKNRIKIIKQGYEKERNIIINQSTDSDCMFFENYISNYYE